MLTFVNITGFVCSYVCDYSLTSEQKQWILYWTNHPKQYSVLQVLLNVLTTAVQLDDLRKSFLDNVFCGGV